MLVVRMESSSWRLPLSHNLRNLWSGTRTSYTYVCVILHLPFFLLWSCTTHTIICALGMHHAELGDQDSENHQSTVAVYYCIRMYYATC